jgi:hypothetical protein
VNTAPRRLVLAIAAVLGAFFSALLGTGSALIVGVSAAWVLTLSALAWAGSEAALAYPDRLSRYADATLWLGRIARSLLWVALFAAIITPGDDLVAGAVALVGPSLASSLEAVTIGLGMFIGLAIIAKIVANDMGHGKHLDRYASVPARAFLRIFFWALRRSRVWAPGVGRWAITWTLTGRLERPVAQAERVRRPKAATLEDPMDQAVILALRDANLPADTFRLRSVDRAYDGATYRYGYAGPTDTAPAWRGAQGIWQGLKDGIAFYAANDKITVAGDLASHDFTVIAKLPPPGFPGGPGDNRTNLTRFIEINAAEMAANPRRFCVGLDHQARPVWIDYRTAPHTIVCGVSGCGKTVSAVLGPILQLASANSPADLSLWLLDSTKHELTLRLASLPHVDKLVVAETGADAMPVFAAFVEAMLDRQRRYRGEEWSSATGDPWLLLVVEEWQALRSSLSKEDLAVIESLMERAAAIGRSAGCHISLTTQKATTDVLPTAISSNLPVKVMGHSRSADYAAILETQVKIAGKDKGRMAVKGIEDEIIMVQGLFATPEEMARIVNTIVARSGRRAA